MAGASILVTGGNGFLGTKIVEALQQQGRGYRLSVADITAPTAANQRQDYHRVDLTDARAVQALLLAVRPAVVVNSVGFIPMGRRRYAASDPQTELVNVGATRALLDAAAAVGSVRAFVHASSCTVVADELGRDHANMTEELPTGRASTTYGRSKTAAEQLVLAANSADMATCALRPAAIVGPGDCNFMPLAHAFIASRETSVTVGSGTNLYDFVYVTNVADAFALAVDNLLAGREAAGQAFFISNCSPVPFWAFLRALWAHFGHVPARTYRLPRPLAYLAGFLSECQCWLAGVEPKLTRASVQEVCMVAYADCSKAKRLLGYQPRVGLADGLRLSCDDYKERLKRAESKGRGTDGLS